MKNLGPGQHFSHYKSMRNYFIAQGQVTLKRMIQPGPNSNWSEMFWLSWIPASYNKLRSTMKEARARKTFPHYKSMGKYFIAQGQVTLRRIDPTSPKFELVRDVLAVLDTCKLQEAAIKNEEDRARTRFSPL